MSLTHRAFLFARLFIYLPFFYHACNSVLSSSHSMSPHLFISAITISGQLPVIVMTEGNTRLDLRASNLRTRAKKKCRVTNILNNGTLFYPGLLSGF